ncbi:hypothetical protein SAY87_005610 [Trapa incisa]|uniref:Uncharacterized protein n=1 Tax=Trapa incisa TaxID=236973 RepID=A0AAN7KB85_9MYRT|nr:hypothetical protein SAY87_005610 [Trapa incisa]
MTVAPLMFRSLVRLMEVLVGHPVAAVTTLLYHGELLPRHTALERYVRNEFLYEDNHFFHFLVNFLRCF